MLNDHGITVKRIYLLGMLVFLLTAWFSVGYNHFDEHFQVIEFAGLKLGLTEKANLPWEYKCMMRPALQPLLVAMIYKSVSWTGITNPFIMALFIRLFSMMVTLVSIHMIIRVYAPGIANRKLFIGFLLLSFFLWFVPYNSVRFSSETFAGRIFLIGLAWFLLREKQKSSGFLITGIILGIAFITRYQVAFMIIGFAVWLAFIRKAGFRNLLLFCAGILIAAAFGVLIDRWYYEEWVLTSWNYFQQNILFDKAAGFGVSPWWYYIEQTFLNAFPPLSLVYILAVFLYILYYPKDLITWTIVPFLAAHFLIPHKEIRFLFPLIGFLPVLIIRSVEAVLKKQGDTLLYKRATTICIRIFWYLNMVMLVILIFRPADDQIALYRQLWDNYTTPAKFYFTDDNPYHRANVDVHFYKRNTLLLTHVDSLQQIVPSQDTVTLVVTQKPLPPDDKIFNHLQVYSTYPQWVRGFNINHWMDRTSFWYVYELRTK